MGDDLIHPALYVASTSVASTKSSFSHPRGSNISANSSKVSSKRSSLRSSFNANIPRSISAPDGPLSLYSSTLAIESKFEEWPPSPKPRKGSMSDLSEIHHWKHSASSHGLLGVLNDSACKKTRIRVLLCCGLVVTGVMILGGILAAIYRRFFLLGGLLIASCLTAVSLLHFWRTAVTTFLQFVVLTDLLLVPFGLQLFTNQFGRGGAIILWAFLCPLLALITGSTNTALRWFIAFFVLGAVVTVTSSFPIVTPGLLWMASDTLLPTLAFMDTYVTLLITFVSMVYIVHELEKTMRVKDGLLQSMFPDSVVEKFIENQIGEDGLIETVPRCTILFADLVGFTQIASSMDAEKLVSLLNCVFSEFDRLARLYGVEKIKTIGDAYMAAHGLTRDGLVASDHDPGVVADMALAMVPVIAKISRQKSVPDLKVRVGIASGNVVAGVIGKCKFAYDIWGDAVNVASRMESTGAPGRIHCSEEIYKALRNRYLFDCRGLTQVKGKGEMVTYYLCSRLLEVASDANTDYFEERLWDVESSTHQLIPPDYFAQERINRTRSPSSSSQGEKTELPSNLNLHSIAIPNQNQPGIGSDVPGHPICEEQLSLPSEVESERVDQSDVPSSSPSIQAQYSSPTLYSSVVPIPNPPAIELAEIIQHRPSLNETCPPMLTQVSPLQSIPISPLIRTTSIVPSDPDTPSPAEKRRFFRRMRLSKKSSSFSQHPIHPLNQAAIQKNEPDLTELSDKRMRRTSIGIGTIRKNEKTEHSHDDQLPVEVDTFPTSPLPRLNERDTTSEKKRRRKKRRRSLLRKGSLLLRRSLLADCLPVWMFSQAEQVDLLLQMYDDLGLIHKFGIDEKKLRVFCTASIAEYDGNNPFHNWEHAVDVCHTVYLFLRRTKAGQLIPPYAQLALLTAAIGHDMGHPGLTNAYQEKAKTSLFALYGTEKKDKVPAPILEQYHLSRLFATLNRPSADFLNHLRQTPSTPIVSPIHTPITTPVGSETEQEDLESKDQKRKKMDSSSMSSVELKAEIFKLMKELILATDMGQHSKYVGAMETVDLTTLDESSGQLKLLCMLIKCADVSNTVKPIGLCKVWADRVMNEFYAQGDLERHENLLPVSPLCDRERDNDIPAIQVGFIKFLQPMWRMMAEKVDGFDVFFKQTERNIIMWDEEKEKQKQMSVFSPTSSIPLFSTLPPHISDSSVQQQPVENSSVAEGSRTD